MENANVAIMKNTHLIGMARIPCLVRSSLVSGDDMMRLRSWDGALKWALRLFPESEETNGLTFIILPAKPEKL